MDKTLERIKAMILKETEGMSDNQRVELLDALAWWSSEQAGSLVFDSPDIESYDD